MTSSAGVVQTLRSAYVQGWSKPLEFRRAQLERLIAMLEENRELWYDALFKDLHKSKTEAELSEVMYTLNEAKHAYNKLPSWIRPQKVKKGFLFQTDTAFIQRQPLGVCLIIGAWNYPLQLCLSPLVGAIAAGNAAIVKPSELSPATADLMARLLPAYLDPQCYAVVCGGVSETTELLEQRFDHIFYTGSSMVGKIVMSAAAKNLTPVVLELGGKSPVYIDEGVDLRKAARCVAWGKFLNCGQTCIGADYVMCSPKIRDDFVSQVKRVVAEFFGADAQRHPDYPRIVNERHFDRLVNLIDEKKVVFGGKTDKKDLYISPTIMTRVTDDDAVMKEEIFGPIMPIIDVSSVDEAIQRINANEKPLALYCFSDNRRVRQKFLDETSSGGVCFNDVVSHFILETLPFGGVGHSGMGMYHGWFSFDCYCHKRSVLAKKLSMEPTLQVRYPPYTESKLKMAKYLIEKKIHKSRCALYCCCAVAALALAALLYI